MKFKVGDLVRINSNYPGESVDGLEGTLFKITDSLYPCRGVFEIGGEKVPLLLLETEIDLVTPEAPSNGAI